MLPPLAPLPQPLLTRSQIQAPHESAHLARSFDAKPGAETRELCPAKLRKTRAGIKYDVITTIRLHRHRDRHKYNINILKVIGSIGPSCWFAASLPPFYIESTRWQFEPAM